MISDRAYSLLISVVVLVSCSVCCQRLLGVSDWLPAVEHHMSVLLWRPIRIYNYPPKVLPKWGWRYDWMVQRELHSKLTGNNVQYRTVQYTTSILTLHQLLKKTRSRRLDWLLLFFSSASGSWAAYSEYPVHWLHLFCLFSCNYFTLFNLHVPSI